jgi:prepilin-type N-terminal cleavage/methylation domain-containing protein
MMPSTPRRDNVRGPRRGGFTLTEMLVVIGIIVLVLSIATPMVTRAWRAGDRTRTAADLQAIASALEAYKQDHGMYPPVPLGAPYSGGPTNFNGARMLCRALIAPGPGVASSATSADIADGAGTSTSSGGREDQAGPGFRTRKAPGPDGRLDTIDDLPQGRVYGPYLPADRFKLGDPDGSTNPKPGLLAILDRYNRPILYYPATGKPNIRLDKSYAAPRIGNDKPMYNTNDNQGARTDIPNVLALMLGDINMDGKIVSPEEPAFEGPFILWSSGPDETFGPPQGMQLNTPENARKALEKSDDITNFRTP